MSHTISKGFDDSERARIAELYWQGFGEKLSVVMGPKPKALHFLSKQLDPEYALIARGETHEVLGVAGFKTSEGALINGTFSDLAKSYGWLSACWRAPLLELVERDLENDILLMDGICVAAQARGMGLGTELLHAIKQEAQARGLSSVRLDVIDSNPRAQALYQRQGFKAVGQEHLGLFRFVFGFRSSTKMQWSV